MYEIGQPEIEAVRKTIESNVLFRYTDPKNGQVARFEKTWARKVGTKHTLAVNSGTSALICGLVGLGVGPGDEVIVPAYTFIATPIAVLATGAIPVIAEIDASLTIDLKDIEKKITPRTKAILPVHMNGLPSNMNAIMRLAKKHSLLVLEDCCQADGGSYKGKRLGSIGHAGGFSFNFFKIIGCGDGGAIVTSDDACYERALLHHDGGCMFREHGKELCVTPFVGQNYRVFEIMGAILNEQVKRLDRMLGKMRRIKKKFVCKLGGHPRLRFTKHNDLDGDCGTHVGFLFKSEEESRRFIDLLRENGVATSTPIDSGRHIYSNWDPILEKRGAHHPEMNPYNMRANKSSRVEYTKDMCPNTLDILARTVMLGTHPSWDAKHVNRIIRACEKAADQI